MELIYRMFLKIKYLNMNELIPVFFEIYKENWGQNLNVKSCMIIESEVIGNELSDEQRKIDMQILDDPKIVSSFVKVSLEQRPDTYFQDLSNKDKKRLLEYLYALMTDTDIMQKLKDCVDLDFPKIPDPYFQLTPKQLLTEIGELWQ